MTTFAVYTYGPSAAADKVRVNAARYQALAAPNLLGTGNIAFDFTAAFIQRHATVEMKLPTRYNDAGSPDPNGKYNVEGIWAYSPVGTNVIQSQLSGTADGIFGINPSFTRKFTDTIGLDINQWPTCQSLQQTVADAPLWQMIVSVPIVGLLVYPVAVYKLAQGNKSGTSADGGVGCRLAASLPTQFFDALPDSLKNDKLVLRYNQPVASEAGFVANATFQLTPRVPLATITGSMNSRGLGHFAVTTNDLVPPLTYEWRNTGVASIVRPNASDTDVDDPDRLGFTLSVTVTDSDGFSAQDSRVIPRSGGPTP
jgi:hypothetical protein